MYDIEDTVLKTCGFRAYRKNKKISKLTTTLEIVKFVTTKRLHRKLEPKKKKQY